MRNSKPLVKAIEKYIKKDYLRLHMPGHKGHSPNSGCGKRWGELWSYDLTEAEGLDNLNAPTGAIRESELMMAELYRAKDAHYLVGGATVGLQAAILASCKPGDRILVPRNAHRSIWSAIALSGATPIWMPVFLHPRFGIPLGIATETVEQAVNQYEDAKAIVYTYPTYHGFCGDLRTMARLAGHKGMLTIVDEAHGSHFRFTGWPDPAVDSGAAIVVNSWHKTMGSLTQTAVMLQNDHNYPVEKYLAMLQTSSPSYPLMASLDEARANWQANDDKLAAKMLKNATLVREGLATNSVLDCLDSRNLPWPVRDYDTTRVVIFSELNHSGYQIEKALQKQGVMVEMADSGTVTLIITAFDREAELKQLVRALTAAGQALERIPARPVPFVDFGELPPQVMTPAAALAHDCEWVELDAAVGRIAAELLVPYPPGIPVVGIGEEITEPVVAGIEYIMEEGGRVQGLKDGKVSVII